MPTEFNPYRQWLGLELRGQPNYYQLLGVADFESNPEAIWAAAYQRRAILRAEQYGDQADVAKRVLEEVDAAEACLLNPGRKTDYDRALRSGEVPPLIAPPSPSPAKGSGSRRSERRLKPGGKSEKQSPPTAEESPPARDPVPETPPSDPIAEAGRSTGPKSAWGYDDGVPFRPEAAGSATGNQPPMAGVPAPMRPTDFLPPPASPASFAGSTTPPLATPPMAAAPMAGVPGAFAPPGWSPGGPPTAAVPPAGVPGYPAGPYAQPQYAPPPTAQPGWAGAPGAAAASVPLAAPYAPSSPSGGYAPAPMASAYAPAAAPMASVPMAAPVTAAVSPDADEFGPLPGAAQGAATIGPVASTRSRRSARRPSPAVYALGGFLVAVTVGVAAIVATNRPPRDDHHAVVHNASDKSHDATGPSTKTPVVVPPEKTGNGPVKTEPAKTDREKTEPMPEKTPAKTEPAKTEPMPEKTPAKTEPTKEPTTKEPTTKQPPKEKPAGDPQRDALVLAALMSARYHLADRDLKKAQEMLAVAKQNGTTDKHRAEVERVRLLSHYVGEFWKAVKSQCKAFDGGAAITIQNITIAFVEGNDEYVMFRRAGRNEKHYFFARGDERMKTGLAIGLAQMYLAKNDAVSELSLGAFQTVNPTSERADARGHFDAAEKLGSDDLKETTRLLRPELDVSIPKEAPKLPSVSGTPEPSDGGKPKPPTGDVLVKAQEAMRTKHKQQLAAAVFESDKAALAEKLHAEAEEEGLDAVARYALLVEARDLATAGRRPKLGLLIVGAIDEIFTIDPLAMKVEVLAASQKSAADDAAANKEVAQSALELADEAALAEKFSPASRLAAMALQTARKAKDPELLKQATAREKEIRALKP